MVKMLRQVNVRDGGPVPWWGRSLGGGDDNPLTPVFLPGESYEHRSLLGYSP